MKTKIQTPRNGSAKSASTQAATPPDSSPAEFKVVRLRECPGAGAAFNDDSAVETFWRAHVETAPWFKADKECLVVFLLNTCRNLLGFEMLSQGTKDTLLINVSEVFRLAVMKSAAAIIVAHNHPSGVASPSEADIKATRDLIRAGAVVKIEVLDHIIIGTPLERGAFCHQSLRGLGYFYEPASAGAGFTVATAEAATAPAVPMPEQKLELLKRENLFSDDQPNMEQAVQRALGLLGLLGRMSSALTLDKGHSSYQGMGFTDWSGRVGKALYENWNTANDARSDDGNKIASVRRLGLSVEKAKALLLMMAHDLSTGGDFDEYDGWKMDRDGSDHLSDLDLSPYLTMATDCAEYLEASYYVDFGNILPMNQFNRDWIETEIVAKFAPHAEQQRRAA